MSSAATRTGSGWSALSAAGTNQDLLVGQIREFLPPLVAIADEDGGRGPQGASSARIQGVELLVGPDVGGDGSRASPRPTWC